jgi:hypothetical protein
MTWTCSHCYEDDVLSVFEWVRVHNYRAHIRENERTIAEGISSRGLDPRPANDIQDFILRWTDAEGKKGPGYICVSCFIPQTNQEVPA